MNANPTPNGVARPGFAPMLLSYVVNFISHITIEPAYFLISFSKSLEEVSLSQMTIYKTCRVDFGYNDTVCNNLVTEFHDENDEIQIDVGLITLTKLK